MTNNINNPTQQTQMQPQHPGIFQDAQGRMWTADAIDQLIVGHLHGRYSFTPTAIYLSRQPNLSTITSEEAEAVFSKVVYKTKPPFKDWTSLPSTDAKVQAILKNISDAIDDVLTFYLNTRGHFSGNEMRS